jgi:hypothetical protein
VIAAQEDLPRQRVMAAIDELGMRGATGVLEITGNPSGAIYLEDGHVAFARASWVPGLATRLRDTGPVPRGTGEVVADSGSEDDAAIAARAVGQGRLTVAGVHELVHSIVIDAFLVLAMPLAVDTPVAAIRFAAATRYWSETFPRLDIGPIQGEATRRAKRLATYGLAPTTTVALRHLRQPVAVLTREQWGLARQISGPASARELAQRCGTALADTAECLGGLIQAGLCTPVRAAGQPRSPRAILPPAATPALPAARSDQPPSAEILRQVLDGLKKLS